MTQEKQYGKWIAECYFSRNKEITAPIVIDILPAQREGSTSAFYKAIVLHEVSQEVLDVFFLKVTQPYFYEDALREIAFYTGINQHCASIDLPLAYFINSHTFPEQQTCWLLFEYIDDSFYQPNAVLPPSEREIIGLMQSIAKCHAAWWNHPSFEEEAHFVKPNSQSISEWHQWLEKVQRHFNAKYSEALGKNRISIYQQLVTALPTILSNMYESDASRWTVIHDDLQISNCLFSENQLKCHLLDWQGFCVGHGASDLAHFYGLTLRQHSRTNAENFGIEIYLNTLKGHGIDYTVKSFWFDYKSSLLIKLFFPAIYEYIGHPCEYWWGYLENIWEACQQKDCGRFLQETINLSINFDVLDKK